MELIRAFHSSTSRTDFLLVAFPYFLRLLFSLCLPFSFLSSFFFFFFYLLEIRTGENDYCTEREVRDSRSTKLDLLANPLRCCILVFLGKLATDIHLARITVV